MSALPSLTLLEALFDGRFIGAACRCSRSGVIDARPWLAERLGDQTLDRLEDRLRCECGARSVPLEPLPAAPVAFTGGGIYAFR